MSMSALVGLVGRISNLLVEPKTRTEIVSLHRHVGDVSPRLAEPVRATPRRLRRLTPDEELAVEDGYLGGLSVYDLGRLNGISRKTVAATLHRRGVPMRGTGLTDDQVTKAVELYADGVSTVRLGVKFGVDAKTVGRALVRAGVTLRPRPGR